MVNLLNVTPRTIFIHDNYKVLRGINSSSIDLIYLDPPFNSKRNYYGASNSDAKGAQFKDIFTKDDIPNEQINELTKQHPALAHFLQIIRDSSPSNYYYLTFMAIRLLEMHRVLKQTGSIWLHCDDTMSHYLKIVMDAIFGVLNFRNEISWKRADSKKTTRNWPRNRDILLFYTKSEQFTFHPPTELSDVWDDIHCLQGQSKEMTGYPTQKPLALLDRIIKTSSNEGDVILDPFCGSATSLVSSEMLGRQWIGIDLNIQAYELAKTRIQYLIPEDLFHQLDTGIQLCQAAPTRNN